MTANNRVAANEFPYPLAGTWSSGYRARRIRERIESQTSLERPNHRDLHQDAVSLRAVACLPGLCAALEHENDPVSAPLVALLKNWNGDCRDDLVAPAVFNVFFVEWCKRVAAERFPDEVVPFLAGGIEGLAAELLRGDDCGWFARPAAKGVINREALIREMFRGTLQRLAARFGDDPAQWSWGRLHRLDLKHVLAARGDLGELLNHGGAGVRGDATTVCNTGRGPDFEAAVGAGFRMICDLGESPAGLWMVDWQSQSGHCGSPHYRDQFQEWRSGRIPLLAARSSRGDGLAISRIRLEPR